MNASLIAKSFQEKFNSTPTLQVKAPGRINLIGEHTDYNDGFVLPAAIDKAIYFSLRPREDDQIRLYAVDLNDEINLNLQNRKKSKKAWANFLIGVINELLERGAQITHGFDLAFGGDVPLGAGMSSSAAIESGMGFALNQMFQLGLSRLQLAKIAQLAEHNFAGVKCGIMDMYASLFGKSEHLIKLDCRYLSHEYLPFSFDEVSVVLFNTGVKHNLADSAYNKRREECERGVEILKQRNPDILSLRDATSDDVNAAKSEMTEDVYKRCFFVTSETRRMMEATDALNNQNLIRFGELMYETHDGLSQDYEVSCTELDFLVNLVRDKTGVFGARMMGGGFGGCTINLIDKSKAREIICDVTKAYKDQFGFEAEHFEVCITDGCTVVSG
ncbi:galactokinase [Jiulongibacter sediminis]|jgi:galactokinase|uniref:galactokinase n=1 Tax=Jiulongibacter sediminis TaxID=1605367 RepID=UPI0026E9F1DF|nr:galactokinase [Jiulongibacter sediminis]